MSVVMQISDHVVVLEYGRKISDGNPHAVRTDPRVIAAYLGVDDEEVETVLTEVGDEDVIEQLDIGPELGARSRHVVLDARWSGDRHGRPQRRRTRHGVEGRFEGRAGRRKVVRAANRSPPSKPRPPPSLRKADLAQDNSSLMRHATGSLPAGADQGRPIARIRSIGASGKAHGRQPNAASTSSATAAAREDGDRRRPRQAAPAAGKRGGRK